MKATAAHSPPPPSSAAAAGDDALAPDLGGSSLTL